MTTPPAPRVLVVDDSRLTRTLIKSALSSAGYEVAGEAVNGQEGIERTGKLKPDLVTVDITMPEKGGLESLEEIQAAHPAVKVILITALGSQKLLQEDAKKVGAVMISKPFNPYDLVRLADRLLGRRSAPMTEPHGLALGADGPLPGTVSGKLTPDQIADLMEVGNIGAGNAASQLSGLVGRRCLISPPQVAFLQGEDIMRTFGPDDYFLASLGLKIMGDIPAVMLVALERARAAEIVKRVVGNGLGADGGLSSTALGALKRAGEFMTRAFSEAVNQFLLTRSRDTLPELTVTDSPRDMEKLFASKSKDPLLLIHCGFSDDEGSFEGKLAYVLAPDAQKTVMKRLKTLLAAL